MTFFIKKTLLIVIGIISLNVFATEHPKIDFNQYKFNIEQTVYKIPVSPGVEPEEVHESILSKGMELNMKFVSHQPLSEELIARGVESGQVDIYQFCNPMDARKMIDFNPIFIAYMPCRIAMVEDGDGVLWLMMVNLDMLINNTDLTPEVREIADVINNKLKTIIDHAKDGDI